MRSYIIHRRRRISLAMLLFIMIMLLAGCLGENGSITTFRLSKAVINRMVPKSLEAEGFDTEELKVIKDKKTIKELIKALEGSEKVSKDLGYARSGGVHYEIQLIYKKAEKMIFSLWIEEDSERAVFSGPGYFYLSSDATELLKSIIFQGKE